MSILALVFDFDGLILDTETTDFQSWQEVYRVQGCELRLEEWGDCVGRPAGHFDPFEHLEQLSGVRVERDRIRAQRNARIRELNLLQPVLPGVRDYLRVARELGLKIGLASSSDRAWVQGHLGRLGLLDCFDTIKCLEDTGAHKPDPAPYLAVLETLRVSPASAVAFEDSPHGVAAAKAAGMLCVAVPNSVTRRLGLERADLMLDSLASLPLPALLSRLDGVRLLDGRA
jgi:HAD superfamily hydrolase (TIGR01509 family)